MFWIHDLLVAWLKLLLLLQTPGKSLLSWLEPLTSWSHDLASLYFVYLASRIVSESWLSVTHLSSVDSFDWLVESLSMKKPGCFGWGNSTPSLLNQKTADAIVGLSSGSFCTHNKLTWIHLNTCDSTYESFKHSSISSNALPSFNSNHAWNGFFYEKHSYTNAFRKKEATTCLGHHESYICISKREAMWTSTMP